MKILVCKCEEPFKKVLKKACRSYASDLFVDQPAHILDNMVIKIKFINNLGADGYCEPITLYEDELPEEFIVCIDDSISDSKALLTLSHEFVHIKQYALGELSPCHGVWKGEKMGKLGYYDQPWEQEADLLEAKIFENFKDNA